MRDTSQRTVAGALGALGVLGALTALIVRSTHFLRTVSCLFLACICNMYWRARPPCLPACPICNQKKHSPPCSYAFAFVPS